MGDPGTTYPPPQLQGQSVALNVAPYSAPIHLPSRQTATSEGIHKPKPSYLRDLRRAPSAGNIDSSNATTSWTVRELDIQNGINPPAQHNTISSPSALASPASATARPTLASRESEGGQSLGSSTVNTQDPLSTKSKFMRVLSKFKSKHLHKGQPPDSVSDASSFILPSTQFGQVESIEYTDQGSMANYDSSTSMRSYVGSSSARQIEPAPDANIADFDRRRLIRLDQDRSGHSSLRAKFKNQVSTTLASIKSSSNLRDKARSQASSIATSPTSPQSPTAQTHQGSNVSADSEPLQSNTAKNRNSKGFWTFPRIRPDSQIAQSLRAANGGPASLEQPSLQLQDQDLDTIMLSPELAPLDHDDEGADSDHSIDIIMPGDYDDYTQFAELPLKKRKKLEAAAAAAQNPAGKRTQGMKRFLSHPKNTDGNKGKNKSTDNASSSTPFPNSDPSTSNIPQRSSRKRPKDQDSIEQKMRQEPNKMIKSNSDEPSEWRRALMRSLHLGRRNPGTPNGDTSSQVDTSSVSAQDTAHSSHRDSGVYPDGQSPHSGHHEGILTVRSRSLATSTHAGLLASTIPKNRAPGSRRETLEMAMRRRRRSSAARSSILDPRGSFLIPSGLNAVDDDNVSANITHTFTSFTLELAELHHAHAVVNNSVTPGLFNFKRQSKALLPAPDVEYEFRSFDSDGDALSGYTGDADVSMEEIFVRPRTPVARSTPEGKDKGKGRQVSSPDLVTRRKVSSVEGESDTVPELPTLSIRTRDLNRSSGGGTRTGGRESPRSPRKAGTTSPTLHRKPSRQFLNGSYVSSANTPPSSQQSGNTPSTDEAVSWKPRNILQQARPPVPALNTKLPLPVTKAGFLRQESLHHQRNSSSYSYSGQHQQQASSDTLLPHHFKNFSTASTMSAGSSYSARTLTGGNGPMPSTSTQPVEFDPSQEFPPTTPVDLKAMDFDTLLKAAEREQQKGSDDLRIKKRKSYHITDLQSLKERHNELNAHVRVDSDVVSRSVTPGLYTKPLNPKSNLTTLVKSAPNIDDLRTRPVGSENINNGGGSTSRNGKSGVPTSRADPLRIPISKSAITFDVDENAVAAAAAASRGNPRTKRVMKKKMSVIRLSGNVQGRREDDGVIRVSVSSPSGDFRQGRAY
ncbi:hypothetical protein BGZ95_007294 [Linnemannia exigua]|uniref:Uncharacterized protein n=1 Tax=Linnemannia exigua TaxID=604196 RepID=A0AAD4H8B4_9FUNG|nr:hypothetical protein BGZ95_007294 [Linnemannia exigua]